MNPVYKLNLPPAVLFLLEHLGAHGYEAFIVGGCVRDAILGNIPNDWDITTSALPEQVTACFRDYKVLPTGLAHGTVSVLYDHIPYEITTYRIDGDYADHRHPNSVAFATKLQEDLARRDFTINAMAYHPEKGLQDYFGGQADLVKGVVRCVGDPAKRFTEDALRMLRCVRFASQLGFSVEPETAACMLQLRQNLRHVSAERIQVELSKALLGQGVYATFLQYPQMLTEIIPEIAPSVGFDQHTPYHIYNVFEHALFAVAHSAPVLEVRLAMLLHDSGKPETYQPDSKGVGHFPFHARKSVQITRAVLTRLKFSNAIINTVLILVKHHDDTIAPTKAAVKKWLNRMGVDTFRLLLKVQKADALAKNPDYIEKKVAHIALVGSVLEEVLEEAACFSLAQLDLNGNDLIQAGVAPGPKVGSLLQQALHAVIEETVPNKKTALLQYLELSS